MQQIFGDAAKRITQSFNALSQRTQIARYQSTGTTSVNTYVYTQYCSTNRPDVVDLAKDPGSRGSLITSTTFIERYCTYTYDPLSRIATIVSTLEGTDTYSYDQTSQLVGATHTFLDTNYRWKSVWFFDLYINVFSYGKYSSGQPSYP